MIENPFFRYFLAFCPAPSAAVDIGQVRDLVGPMRARVTNDRLHMTLAVLAERRERDLGLVERTYFALTGHGFRSPRIDLRRLAVNTGTASLLPVGRQADLREFQSSLMSRLAERGVTPLRPKTFRPHVTLGYFPQHIQRRVIAPIGWRADQIVLIESWVGRYIHRPLAHWRLGEPAQYEFDFDAQPSLGARARIASA